MSQGKTSMNTRNKHRPYALSKIHLQLINTVLILVFNSQLSWGAPNDQPVTPINCPFQSGWTDNVIGGLSGEILKVTNLNAAGEGSLKEAIEKEGARTIVFEVGGTINLNGETLNIRHPFITIAGQTAPSPGITITGGGMLVKTHDVVIQHVRIRPGSIGQKKGWQPDGLSISKGYNIIIDHCSVAWGVDENMSASGPRFEGTTLDEWRKNTSHTITFSNNIIAEALDDSTHSEGPHSKGTLLHDNVTEALLYRNLYSSNRDRNPRLKAATQGAIINNMIVNPGVDVIRYGSYADQWKGKKIPAGEFSIVGNIIQYGEDTKRNNAFLRTDDALNVFMQDNNILNKQGDKVNITRGSFKELEQAAVWPNKINLETTTQLATSIWNTVGARPWDRDTTDKRIIEEAKKNTTRIIDIEIEMDKPAAQKSKVTHKLFDPKEWDICLDYIKK